MPATIEEILSEFANELHQTSQRYAPFISKAENEGYPLIAKFFRSIVTSENVREERFRCGMAHHAREVHDYYICPHCGLVFVPEAPEKCPVDNTLGTNFTIIS